MSLVKAKRAWSMSVVSVAIVILGFGALALGNARAQSPPCVFSGAAYLDDSPVSAGAVSVWIGGEEVAKATTDIHGNFYVQVTGNNYRNHKVNFLVNGVDARETATWSMGKTFQLDLHAYSPETDPLSTVRNYLDESVWSFDNETKKWLQYYPAEPETVPQSRRLTAFESGNTYWLYVIDDCILRYDHHEYSLTKGWNSIGWVGEKASIYPTDHTVNHPPTMPSNPSPRNHATDISEFTLSWDGGDPDGDSVTYDVYFGTSSPPPLLFSEQAGTSVTKPFPMPPNGTKCYWRVVATDNHGASIEGPIWEFTIKEQEPPKQPFINIKISYWTGMGRVGHPLLYSASIDSNISGSPEYRFDWGDGRYSSWSSSQKASHAWSEPGTYSVKAQARYPGIVSDWSEPKTVTIKQATQCRYITPDDPAVKAAVNDILDSPLQVFTDFETLRDWVCSHISYRSDMDVHGESEYWQKPAQTLQLGTGDCEDFAILLCSLLRANGVPADKVYVAVGCSKDSSATCHAYLMERWYQGVWRVTEAEAGSWSGWFIQDWITDIAFEEIYCFNDKNYIDGYPTLPQGVYEFQLSFLQRMSAIFKRQLQTGQRIEASVEWLKRHGELPDFSTFGWGFKVYGPSASAIYKWFGDDLSRTFHVTAPTSGEYQVKVYIGGGFPASARLTVDPPRWVRE